MGYLKKIMFFRIIQSIIAVVIPTAWYWWLSTYNYGLWTDGTPSPVVDYHILKPIIVILIGSLGTLLSYVAWAFAYDVVGPWLAKAFNDYRKWITCQDVKEEFIEKL